MNILRPIYKPVGITPLEAIQQFKSYTPQYNDQPISYAGRLDPMAHGVLLLMIGDANKERAKYLHMPKTYVFEAVLGMQTDSYDVLGLVKYGHFGSPKSAQNLCEDGINTFISHYTGIIQQPYPPFSSKTIKGKPLFWWAKEGRLDEITIPTHEVEVYSFLYKKMRQISAKTLQEKIGEMIMKVKGDFRQKEIQTQWDAYFAQIATETYPVLSFVIECSSGTYIRSIVHKMGIALGTGAIALDIYRTKVGEYSVS